MCSHYVAWAAQTLSRSRSLHYSLEDSPNLFEKLPPRRANTLPSSFRLESVSRPIRISINNIARLPSPVRFQESLARRRRSLARPPLILENTSDNSDIAAANEREREQTELLRTPSTHSLGGGSNKARARRVSEFLRPHFSRLRRVISRRRGEASAPRAPTRPGRRTDGLTAQFPRNARTGQASVKKSVPFVIHDQPKRREHSGRKRW